jgi:hypothetical protein
MIREIADVSSRNARESRTGRGATSPGFSSRGPGEACRFGPRGAERRCEEAPGEVLTAAEGRAVPSLVSGGGESRTSDGRRRVPPQRGQVRTSVWKVRLSIRRRCVPANKDPRTVSSRATWIEWISNESRTLATASPVHPDLSRMTVSPDVEQVP